MADQLTLFKPSETDYAPLDSKYYVHLCTYYIIEMSLLCTPFCTAMESDNMYLYDFQTINEKLFCLYTPFCTAMHTESFD